MKLRAFLCALLCVSPPLAYSQALSGNSLTLTGPQNSQELGGVGSAGDTSCPANLQAGQFATCYLSKDGALELAYPGSGYSAIVRQSDLLSLQAAQTAVTAQVANPRPASHRATGSADADGQPGQHARHTACGTAEARQT